MPRASYWRCAGEADSFSLSVIVVPSCRTGQQKSNARPTGIGLLRHCRNNLIARNGLNIFEARHAVEKESMYLPG